MKIAELERIIERIKENKNLHPDTKKVLIKWEKELSINEIRPISRMNYLKNMFYFDIICPANNR